VAKERTHTTRHPDERSESLSRAYAREGILLNRGRPLRGPFGSAFGMTAKVRRAFHCGRESCAGSAARIKPQCTDF